MPIFRLCVSWDWQQQLLSCFRSTTAFALPVCSPKQQWCSKVENASWQQRQAAETLCPHSPAELGACSPPMVWRQASEQWKQVPHSQLSGSSLACSRVWRKWGVWKSSLRPPSIVATNRRLSCLLLGGKKLQGWHPDPCMPIYVFFTFLH